MPTPANIQPMSPGAIDTGADLIRDGQLVAFATETVYGLGADATNGKAVARIFAAKNRPSFNPLISHVATVDEARRLGKFSAAAERAAEELWPGPLTLVVPRLVSCPVTELTTAGLETIAIRVPAKASTRDFLAACGCPVAAPSANASGRISPTTAEHVATSLPLTVDGGPQLILDDGACSVGLESTVLDVSSDTPTILRTGGISCEQLEKIFPSVKISGADDSTPRSPGMLSKHYAPSAPLRMNQDHAEPGEVHIGFADIGNSSSFNLSPRGDLVEAAANLFAFLHEADRKQPTAIAVASIPNSGLGQAINDRLQRAAHSNTEP